MKTITYHSTNADPSKAWMAYVILPNGQMWMVPAFASNETEAVDKITKLYENERAKVKQPVMVDEPEQSEVVTGRGHHFAGKTWLINSVTREKIRVDKDKVDSYLNDGWERGGPRSK